MRITTIRHIGSLLPFFRLFRVFLTGLVLSMAGQGSALGLDQPSSERRLESAEQDEGDIPSVLDSWNERQSGLGEEIQPVAVVQQQQFRYWTTNWTFSEVDVATLAQRLARIGITAPVDLAGKVSVAFTVSIPINALRDATAYRFDGTFTSSRLRVDSTELSLSTQVVYTDGIATLNIIQGAILDPHATELPTALGRFQGEASLRLAGEGERLARIRLALQQLQMTVIGDAISSENEEPLRVTGMAEGTLRWVAPVESFTDPATWTAEGQLGIENLSVDERTPLNVNTGPLRIADGKLHLPEARIDVADVPEAGLQAHVEADFRETQPWSVGLVSKELPIESLAAVLALGTVPATGGELSLDLNARGTLTPFDWNIEGTFQSPELSLLGISFGELDHQLLTDASQFELRVRDRDVDLDTRIQSMRADYTIAPEAFHLTRFDAELFEGNFQGDVRWAREAASSHEVNLDWSDLQWTWDVGSLTTGVPGDLTFSTEGRVAWQAPFDKIDLPAEQSVRAWLQLDNVMLAGQPIGNISAKFRAIEGELALQGRGDLLGGTFQVDTATSIPEELGWTAWISSLGRSQDAELDSLNEAEAWQPGNDEARQDGASTAPTIENGDPLGGERNELQEEEGLDPGELSGPVSGRMELRGISLAQVDAVVRRWIGSRGVGGEWGGGVDAVVDFDLGESDRDQHLRTVSRVRLTNLSINRTLVTRELVADLRGSGLEWRLDRVRGRYAGGLLQAMGRGSLVEGPREINLLFSRVDAGRALLPLAADAAQWIRGELSGQVRVHGGAVTRVVGSVEGRRVDLFGLPLGLVRTGISGQVRPAGGRWEFRFPNVGTTLARGRVAGQAMVRQSTSGQSFDLESEWSMANVDFESLLRGWGSTSRVGRGNVSGSLSLNGRNIRNVSDLQGRFNGTLGGTAAAALPGWSRIRGFLGPIGGSAMTFTDGELRGRILRGSVRIDQLTLRSDRLRIAAYGSVRLDNSRMDIDAVVATGDFSTPDLIFQEVARRVALVSAPPLGLLLTLNRWLSDRVVYLNVGGTPTAAVVRVRPAETLGRNALQFFLQEVTLGASSVAFDSLSP